MIDPTGITEIMSQTAATAGAGGGAVGVLTGGSGVLLLARYLLKRTIDAYDEQIKDLKRQAKETEDEAAAAAEKACARIGALETKVAVLEAFKSMPLELGSKIEAVKDEIKSYDDDIGVAHRRIERLAEKAGVTISDIQKRQR